MTDTTATVGTAADKPAPTVKVVGGGKGTPTSRAGAAKPAAKPKAKPAAKPATVKGAAKPVKLTDRQRAERRQARRALRRQRRVDGIVGAIDTLSALVASGAVKGATADKVRAVITGLYGARPSARPAAE